MRLALVVRLAPAAVLLAATLVPAEEWTVSSPDGRLGITLVRHPEGRLSWRAARGSAVVIADSPLGLRRADEAFAEGLKSVRAAKVIVVDERYEMPHGKRRPHQVRGREQTVEFATAAGARLEVVLRAHHDGVAFRYRIPNKDATARTVVDEQTGFHVPAGATAWLLPHPPPSKYGPAYEDFFQEVAAGTAAPTPSGWSFPGLFKTPAGVWLLVTEAGLDETYCGARFAADAPGGAYRIRFPEAGEGEGVGEVNREAG